MSHLGALQNDLRNATVKEITDCMKAVNDTLQPNQRLVVSGKKEEIIQRFSTFIVGLVENNKKASIATVVRLVNETVPRKLSWKYEEDEIKVNCHRQRRAATNNIESMNFVQSPFIKPIFRLTAIKICPVAGQARQSKAFTFLLNDANRQLLATPNACDDRAPYQIRFYCSKYTGNTDNLLLEFPAICELKVNDCVIPGHNLRCIKSKPGTVNPPDISIMSKKHAQNNVELIYINSNTPFIASAYIVERTPVQSLIDKMKTSKVLTKEKVLEKLQRTQEDADIIMESETISTKCPLAFTRIATPIRSKSCNHLQCFDAFTFLTMNEQTPTWSCPVCQRRIDYWEDLIIDEYFTEMLQNTPKHIDSVRVEPNGHVTIIDENPDLADQESEEEEETPQPEIKAEPEVTILLDDDDSGDEDVSAVPAVPPVQSSQESTTNNSIPANTLNPATIRRTPDATASSPQQPPRKKAKTSDVIDLTLSSDDEDDDNDLVRFTSSPPNPTTAQPLQEVPSNIWKDESNQKK